ncbi:dolichyl-P-Man:Man(5)GlcNAc(2)-PP-dolichol alpha-1,3-mannosyltransferase [Coemansia javaensis]|uniref:Dol-P-Man:Man(5)GlcNAc(2)-PP-Dol alpha-1,3-mannosyltransferase n=1 Tax=Coemansia javaensis TaxID=2761396 RepID=A0A9W8H7L4_9FUNG|nr:dolichyl-P-Man:Man(5)GlcNAc(2)-PP-dolichol alpha-1,3-mannosyltransferase [Coemansia javaensis]
MAWAARAQRLAGDAAFTQRYFAPAAAALVLLEAGLTYTIIQRVAYTEIDWLAYMQEVEGVARGERNYSMLKGDTGPLVYPAGFVWVYGLLRAATRGGSDLRTAQYVFMGVYLATLAVVACIYRAARVPTLWLAPLALSKRLHSIYVLRLFNDPVAMLAAYAGVLALGCCSSSSRRALRWSGLLFSLGVSVKMNVQLMLPGAAYIWWRAGGLRMVAAQAAVVVASQALVAAPFLLAHPAEYLGAAFDYGRQFDYTWTVNWRFVGERVFASPAWARALLAAHAALLAVLGLAVWPRLSGSSALAVIRQGLRWRGGSGSGRAAAAVTAHEAALVVFTANLAGVLCARTLHYQFYAWYAHTLPLLLHYTRLPLGAQAALWLAIEAAWNVYPSTSASSAALLAANAAVLAAVVRRALARSPAGPHAKTQ